MRRQMCEIAFTTTASMPTMSCPVVNGNMQNIRQKQHPKVNGEVENFGEQKTKKTKANATALRRQRTIDDEMETAINENFNGNSKRKCNNDTNKITIEKCIMVDNSSKTNATYDVINDGVHNSRNNNNNHNHNTNNNDNNSKNCWKTCNGKSVINKSTIGRRTVAKLNCDFFNFVTILFAMFAIVNVQFSSGLIEMQNEKEKHGKFILTSTYFLFVVESPIDFMLNVSKCW